MATDVTVALIGATVVGAGWLVLHYLERSREDRRRRLERRFEYVTRQIEEFYGPLFNLVHQIFLANHVQHAIISAGRLSDEQKLAVRDYFQREHFSGLHDEINAILKHKLHLIRNREMPESFYLYLMHALQERAQYQLWEHGKVDTSFLPGSPWPQRFYDDLKEGFLSAMADYETALGGLRRT